MNFKYLIVIATLFISCGDDDITDTGIIGTWELIETLADPGDGSGVFMEVDSDKTITFSSDGTIESNGSLCDISTTSDNSSSGTYSIEDNTFIADCSFSPTIYIYEVDGNELTINYACIEPCAAKYRKR